MVRRIDAEDHFALVSSEGLESIPAGAGTYTFPTQLPIGEGDQVGLESDKGTELGYLVPLPGAQSFIYDSATPTGDGGVTPDPFFSKPDLELTYNVDVEPDCDKDRLGDETKDPDTSSCKPPPSNAFTLGKPRLNKKKGTAKEPVTVPGPGVLTLIGTGVVAPKPASQTVSAAGTVSLLVKSKGKKKRKLNNTGKANVKITVTYTPTGGTPSSKSKGLALKKSLH